MHEPETYKESNGGTKKNKKLSRGEICVANFLPPCKWLESKCVF